VIAALFVVPPPRGVYCGLDDVDPWFEERDARTYPGPWPVVAHPPCERWGRYWSGGPSVRVRKQRGDDGGCFAAALAAVRRWGGVLEHPEASSAWSAHGLIPPLRGGGWSVADWQGGWTCCVEQGHYGHRARKATWLYACGVADLPRLHWGRSRSSVRLDDGFHSIEERRRVRKGPSPQVAARRLGKQEILDTPLPFRDMLLGIARSIPSVSLVTNGSHGR